MCGKCHHEGHDSRLLVQRSVGRQGGEYFYFFCSRKQEQSCATRYMQIEDVEDAVAHHYGSIRFTEQFAMAMRAKLHETLDDQTMAAKLLRDQIAEHMAKLDRQEDNLLDLAGDTSGPKDKLRARLRNISAEREKLTEQLEHTDDRLEVGAAVIEAALDLLNDPEELYRRSAPKNRRLLNQAIFVKLYVDDNEVTDHVMREPFAEMHAAQSSVALDGQRIGKRRRPEAAKDKTEADLLVAALAGRGSSKTAMVELLGRYSNQDIATRFRQILAGEGRDDPPARATRPGRRNQSLKPDEVRELLAAYAAGTPIDRVAEHFGIHRTTALNIVKREGVPRRWKTIERHLEEARELYDSGLSMAKVGQHFGVSTDAVREAFLRHSVPIRPRNGWRY